MIEKVKNTVTWSYVISDISGDETVGKFFGNGCRIEESNREKRWSKGFMLGGKVMKSNCWIDKKDIV